MRLWAGLLFGSLGVAGIVSGASDNATAAPAQVGSGLVNPFVLVGASGHDSVGSLLPLPLLPEPRFRRAKSWKGKSRPCCAATRFSGKIQR